MTEYTQIHAGKAAYDEGCERPAAPAQAPDYPAAKRLSSGFAAAFRAEVRKGRRAAPRKIALIAPLPFCLMGMAAGGLGGGGAVGSFSTYGWNYWYVLMLPIATALIAASVANIDVRHKLRSVLGLPLPAAYTWWAKIAYVLALVFFANLVVLAASMITGLLGDNTPSLTAGLATAALLVVSSAWMVPVGIALTTRFGTLIGIAVPAIVQLGIGISLWTSSIWYLFPATAGMRAASPFVGVAPSGVPLEAGDPLGVFGWETAVGLALAAAVFAVLALVGSAWFSRKEAQ